MIVRVCSDRDGRAWICPGAALLDSDGGRKPLDEIHVWLFHSIEKLPCISGEAFDVAPLPFGIKSVEGQRGFPRTTQTGDDNQLLPWNFHVKVFEIVLAGTANFDKLRRHSDQKRRTYQSSTAVSFLPPNCVSTP